MSTSPNNIVIRISAEAFAEIAGRLMMEGRAAQIFENGGPVIDMHGIALRPEMGVVLEQPRDEAELAKLRLPTVPPANGRWVFQRPAGWHGTYLVRTPEGGWMRDHGSGRENAYGKIVAWLELYPEPPLPRL
jgi:hypothetical protein